MPAKITLLGAAGLVAGASAAATAGGVTVDTTLPRVIINSDEYTATPNGWVLSHCVYEIPHNAESRRDEATGRLQVVVASEEDGAEAVVATIPPCKPLRAPQNAVLRPHVDDNDGAAVQAGTKADEAAADALRGTQGRRLQLPADYNGWLQYTAFHNATAGFDVFTSLMSVPDTPAATPQILYLFPGLQNIDWIPKVDPMPKTPFDIIQPVLQYPYLSGGPGGNGRDWGVRSWYVTVDSGALMSPEKLVSPGDSVISNMTRTGDDSWFIGSKLTSSGVETNQKATASRLASQPWAYNTVECYGCRGCSTYPDNDFTISECEISTFAGGAVDIVWESNPKPAKQLLCNEQTTIQGPDAVKFDFQ